MKYYISKPSLLLSQYVKQYWSMENCIPDGHQYIHRIVPNGLLELMFYLGDKPVSKDNTKSINENTFLTGQLREYYDIQISGKLSLFSILFKPYGLSVFLDIPLNELYNQNVPLKFIFKNETDELETKLFEANSFKERILIVESYLLKLFQKNTKKNNIDRIKESVSIINQSKGVVDIDFLASESCFSRRQFERTFSHYIGTSPKQFLKILRFQNAIKEKSKNKNISLTELTYKCGYYDQSHMINDFHKLTGMSPRHFFKDEGTYSDYFQ